MRITPRAALVGLVTALALLLSVGAVGAVAKPKPVTTRAQERAQNRGLIVASRAVKALNTGLKTTNANVAKDKATLTGVSTALTALQGTVANTISTATTALGKLQTGLQTLSTAVSDATTGLPGLNNARPLIGFVVGDAAVTGSEFTLVGHGPLGGGAEGFVLSFVNGAGTATDVSKRVYEVTSADPTPPITTTFSAANCSQAAAGCAAVLGSPDAKVTDVLVAASADLKAFQIAAISG